MNRKLALDKKAKTCDMIRMISASGKPVNVGRKVFRFQQKANNDENIEIYKSKSKFKTVPLLRTKTMNAGMKGESLAHNPSAGDAATHESSHVT